MLRHATPCHATPCHATPCHASPCHAMPWPCLGLGASGGSLLRPASLGRCRSWAFFGLLLLLLLLRPWTSLFFHWECSTSFSCATPYCASPRCVAPRCSAPRSSAPRHASPRRATSRRAASRRASPRRAVPCCALLRLAICLAFRLVLPFGALTSRCWAAGVWDGRPYLFLGFSRLHCAMQVIHLAMLSRGCL